MNEIASILYQLNLVGSRGVGTITNPLSPLNEDIAVGPFKEPKPTMRTKPYPTMTTTTTTSTTTVPSPTVLPALLQKIGPYGEVENFWFPFIKSPRFHMRHGRIEFNVRRVLSEWVKVSPIGAVYREDFRSVLVEVIGRSAMAGDVRFRDPLAEKYSQEGTPLSFAMWIGQLYSKGAISTENFEAILHLLFLRSVHPKTDKIPMVIYRKALLPSFLSAYSHFVTRFEFLTVDRKMKYRFIAFNSFVIGYRRHQYLARSLDDQERITKALFIFAFPVMPKVQLQIYRYDISDLNVVDEMANPIGRLVEIKQYEQINDLLEMHKPEYVRLRSVLDEEDRKIRSYKDIDILKNLPKSMNADNYIFYEMEFNFTAEHLAFEPIFWKENVDEGTRMYVHVKLHPFSVLAIL